MCGIIGMVAKKPMGFLKKHEDIFFDLLYTDALRGFDSTGVIGVESDGRWHIAKEASEATEFIPKFRSSQIMKDLFSRGVCMIGHNRKATKGKVDNSSAHPFVVGKTFGMVHNGTLFNHEQLAKTSVDSEALAIVTQKAIESDDTVEGIKETYKDVWGAYAIAAYSQKKHKAYLYRNMDRPLSIVETDDAFFWASELGMLQWILTREGRHNFKDLKYIPVLTHELFSFDLASGEMTKESAEPKKSYTSVTTTSASTQPTVAGVAASKTTHSKPVKLVGAKQFRHLKNGFLGKIILFWPDDYVEEDFPNTVEKGATNVFMWGTKDEWDFKHSILGQVDLTPFNFNKDPGRIFRGRWKGVIEGMEVDKETGELKVNVVDMAPAPLSLDVKKEENPVNDFQERLDYEEKLKELSDGELVLEGKKMDSLKAWQLALIGKEQRDRAYETSSQEYHKTSTALH